MTSAPFAVAWNAPLQLWMIALRSVTNHGWAPAQQPCPRKRYGLTTTGRQPSAVVLFTSACNPEPASLSHSKVLVLTYGKTASPQTS